MSSVEDRVRDAFRADAETVRPETIPGLRPPITRSPFRRLGDRPSRPRQRRAGRPGFRPAPWLIPVAAAAAVVMLAAGAAAISAHAGHRHEPPGPASHPATPITLPPGAPHFYIKTIGQGTTQAVYATATGQTVATLRPPHGTFLAMVTGTADGRLFVTAAQQSTGRCFSRLYSFRLNDGGQPGPLAPLHLTVPGTFANAGSMAITPDGRTLAYATGVCGRGTANVGVVSLASGQTRAWTDDSGGIGPMDLSLSADGQRLAFTEDAPVPGGSPVSVTRLMTLDTRAPGGSLLRHSHVVSGAVPDWSALASDGTSIYGCTVAPLLPTTRPQSMTYYVRSAVNGQRKTIVRWQNLPEPYCWASLDPSGRYAMIEYPTVVPGYGQQAIPAILDLRSGKLIRIPARPFGAPADLTW